MLTLDPAALFDALLETTIADFDVPLGIHQLAVRRYKNLGGYLADHWDDHPAGGVIYPQGSIRLGTMVRPIAEGADYDVDLVCRRDISKASTTQAGLKAEVGDGVSSFVGSGPDGNPQASEGKRCWTLDYPAEPFHMDVLPALPDPDAAPNGLLITDRDHLRWLSSNPVDYASWFHSRMEREFLEKRSILAAQMDVDEVPDWYVKTALQRAVQALKRHRDVYFTDTPELRPASIIITTLAAQAFTGDGPLYEVVRDVTATMPALLERRNGTWWLENPIQPKENFADRWQDEPGSDERFFAWMEQAKIDFAATWSRAWTRPDRDQARRELRRGPAQRAGHEFGGELRTRGTLGRLGAGRGLRDAREYARRPARVARTRSTAMSRNGLSAAQQAFALRAHFPDGKGRLRPAGYAGPAS